jgi:hypothetical protein
MGASVLSRGMETVRNLHSVLRALSAHAALQTLALVETVSDPWTLADPDGVGNYGRALNITRSRKSVLSAGNVCAILSTLLFVVEWWTLHGPVDEVQDVRPKYRPYMGQHPAFIGS